jgi:ribose-phosphate pyrophosphokinase
MTPLLFELSAAPGLPAGLAERLPCEIGNLSRRQFPDGESYLRFDTPVEGRDVILLCTLDRPDPKLAPLLFAARAARENGARSIGLVSPYLAYMRQDTEFHPGEVVTSRLYAQLVSEQFDWLVTIDPHLHRYPALDAIYAIPAVAATATDAIADWIRDNVIDPVIVGPDEESRQWVDRIAGRARARSIVLTKERSGDYSVTIDPAALKDLGSGTPVLVDDIASSARTLIEAARLVKRSGREATVCAVVHAIFAGDSYERLQLASVPRVVSTNSVAHQSNAIDVSDILAAAIREALGATRATPAVEEHSASSSSPVNSPEP